MNERLLAGGCKPVLTVTQLEHLELSSGNFSAIYLTAFEGVPHTPCCKLVSPSGMSVRNDPHSDIQGRFVAPRKRPFVRSKLTTASGRKQMVCLSVPKGTCGHLLRLPPLERRKLLIVNAAGTWLCG
jgi:hypothetical protein